MFNQVVAGVDGLQGGSDAIALATNLLAPNGELTLAHLYGGIRIRGAPTRSMRWPNAITRCCSSKGPSRKQACLRTFAGVARRRWAKVCTSSAKRQRRTCWWWARAARRCSGERFSAITPYTP